jgi:hypothetical protein
MEEDYIIAKWAQEDVETLYSLLNNNKLTNGPQTGCKPKRILLTLQCHKQDCCMHTVQSGSA